MKNRLGIALVALVAVAVVGIVVFRKASTPQSRKDGVYQGEFHNEEKGSSTRVTLKMRGGKIVDCQMTALDAEGHVKDENYGKNSGAENYRRAQLAVEGMQQYPEMLLKMQDVDTMDAVSGATVTFKEFQAAVRRALKEAK
ncbi:MAG: FMN-binding protein [Dethiosulfovibrio peptidovorans]|nr:MAG: FMN-binding protein [Dethiosulfovibrio peptidovorans]